MIPVKSPPDQADKSKMGKGDLTPRIITNFAVEFRTAGDERFCGAWPVNLSETGACVRVRHDVTLDQSMELRIALEEGAEPMVVTAQVAWIRPDAANHVSYCGLGFVDLSDAHRRQIQAYVEAGSDMLFNFLSEFPLFANFSWEDCRRLLHIVTRRHLEKRDILYYEGTCDTDLQGLFIVQSGLLSIYKGKHHAPERQLGVVSPGQLFGETTLVNDQPHSATVMAVNDSNLIQINKVGFCHLSQDEPRVALKLMEVVAKTLTARLGRTTKKLFSPTHIGA